MLFRQLLDLKYELVKLYQQKPYFIFPHLSNNLMEPSRVSAKKVSIRAQRRKEEIQQFFASKRKLLLGSLAPNQNAPFIYYYRQLEEGRNISQNLIRLANFLAGDQPFRCFDENGSWPNRQIFDEYCFKLAQLVLLNIASSCRTTQKADIQTRISCITLISNLAADEQVNNQLICHTICSFLKEIYFNIDSWGIDKETKEIGWLIGNLIGKQIVNNSESSDISYVLEWIQEILRIPEVDILGNLYRNLPQFLQSLQFKHSLTPVELPELYKSNIINILVLSIEKHLLSSLPPRFLARVVKFLSSKVYIALAYCPNAIAEVIISKVMPLLGSLSLELVKNVFELLRVVVNCRVDELIPHQRKILQAMEKIRLYIVQNYSLKLMNLLSYREAKHKRETFKFIHSLLQSPSHNTLYFIATLTGNGLEEVLDNLVKYDEGEIKHDCMHLEVLIYRLSKGKYGGEFLQKMQSLEKNADFGGSESKQQGPI